MAEKVIQAGDSWRDGQSCFSPAHQEAAPTFWFVGSTSSCGQVTSLADGRELLWASPMRTSACNIVSSNSRDKEKWNPLIVLTIHLRKNCKIPSRSSQNREAVSEGNFVPYFATRRLSSRQTASPKNISSLYQASYYMEKLSRSSHIPCVARKGDFVTSLFHLVQVRCLSCLR